MKTITKYKAEDGTEFSELKCCALYESQCLAISAALGLLRPVPEDWNLNFANGGGYIPQRKPDVLAAYREVLEVARQVVGSDVVQKTLDAGEFLPKSIIGRYLDDSGHRAIYRAWHRFMNLDDQWREWGQGYFAANPNKGKQIDLSKHSA